MASRGLSTAEIIGGVFPQVGRTENGKDEMRATIKEKASSIREAERGLLLIAVPHTRRCARYALLCLILASNCLVPIN